MVVEAGAAADTAAAGAAATETTIEPNPARAAIETVLEEHVRPDLRADGGDVVVVGLDEDNILQVRLTGACQGCSSSIMTLTMRVEATLKAQVPRDPLRRGCSVTSAPRAERPSRAGAGRARPTSIFLSAHRMRLLRFRFARRGRPSGRPIPGGARARDRDLPGRAPGGRHDLRGRGYAHAARRDAVGCAVHASSRSGSFSRTDGEWTVEANPGTIDAEKADVLARSGRRPHQPGRPVISAGAARGARA